MPNTDQWARDLASEAKELSVRAVTIIEAHERACTEREANHLRWREQTTQGMAAVVASVGFLRTDMWSYTLRGILAVLAGSASVIAALAIVAWALLRARIGV